MGDGFDLHSELAGAVRDTAGAWRFLRLFAARYARPIVDGDGCGDEELRAAEARLGFPLPGAVREFYAFIGKRSDLVQGQNRLLPPHLLDIDDRGQALVFRWENQYVSEWGIPLPAITRSDPPVVSRYVEQSVWHPFLDRFSLACVEMVLSEWVMSGDGFGANLEMEDEIVAALKQDFHRLPLPDYPRWADAPPVRWFEGLGAILQEDSETSLWVRAPSAAAIAAVQLALPGDWSPDEAYP